MKWKTFWQIVLLMIIAGALSYLVLPKYHFSSTGYKGVGKFNKVTGEFMVWHSGVDAEGNPKGQRGWRPLK